MRCNIHLWLQMYKRAYARAFPSFNQMAAKAAKSRNLGCYSLKSECRIRIWIRNSISVGNYRQDKLKLCRLCRSPSKLKPFSFCIGLSAIKLCSIILSSNWKIFPIQWFLTVHSHLKVKPIEAKQGYHVLRSYWLIQQTVCIWLVECWFNLNTASLRASMISSSLT